MGFLFCPDFATHAIFSPRPYRHDFTNGQYCKTLDIGCSCNSVEEDDEEFDVTNKPSVEDGGGIFHGTF